MNPVLNAPELYSCKYYWHHGMPKMRHCILSHSKLTGYVMFRCLVTLFRQYPCKFLSVGIKVNINFDTLHVNCIWSNFSFLARLMTNGTNSTLTSSTNNS